MRTLLVVAIFCYFIFFIIVNANFITENNFNFELFIKLLALFFILIPFLIYRRRRKEKQLEINANFKLKELDKNSFVLYLRPFSTSGKLRIRTIYLKVLDRILMGKFWDFELSVSLELENLFPLIAIGHHEESLGAAKLITSDKNWQDAMISLSNQATFIVVVPFESPSTFWEIDYVFSNKKLLEKTIFFMPPTCISWITFFEFLIRGSIKRKWRKSQATLSSMGIFVPDYRRSGCFFTLNPTGDVKKIYSCCFFHDGYFPAVLNGIKNDIDDEISLSTHSENCFCDRNKTNIVSRVWRYFYHGILGLFQIRALMIIISIALVVRFFIAEPFRIPSGSMLPTLEIGDFILVSKFSYGVRVPVINKKLVDFGGPERGDVIVFRYPENPSIVYIKRVIGVPGDEIAYYNKVVHVNGKTSDLKPEGVYQTGFPSIKRLNENLVGVEHDILIDDLRPAGNFILTVPEGNYFVLGDNRDNSRDSRYWGFVPDENLVGKAFLIWMNWNCVTFNGNCKRIGTRFR